MSSQNENTPDSRRPDSQESGTSAEAEELAAQLAAYQSDEEADDSAAEPAFDWLASAKAGQQGPERTARPLPEAVKRSGQEPAAYTEMLSIRPPEEEVERRSSERVQAADARPVMPRIWQVIVAICFPVVLVAAAIRLIASPLFLWAEYYRPGFPADVFGFSTEDRLTYGSYTVDYLNNLAGSRYLGDLVGPNGQPLFAASEVSHMADVKLVYGLSMLVAFVLLAVLVIGVTYLLRRNPGGVRRALFAGSMAILVIMIVLAVLALTGWERFFTGFHQIFFTDGTWVFAVSDTLIRLFPGPFWTDSAIVIAALVLIVASLVFAFTWPTKRRRSNSAEAQRYVDERRTGEAGQDDTDTTQRRRQGRRAAS
ncbi:TIGR01906 family membrane protein [Acaricomes phytoseiuli]|uniref:TIGR01906 family membrane protein n=1 Tax=Acaricomes phytoseiuli TaxID=291968 RepID=UPI000367E2DD|nr:TIGR01906 family membrane protein [Acaricomes phytoseiuli]